MVPLFVQWRQQNAFSTSPGEKKKEREEETDRKLERAWSTPGWRGGTKKLSSPFTQRRAILQLYAADNEHPFSYNSTRFTFLQP